VIEVLPEEGRTESRALNFVLYRLMFGGPQCGTCFFSQIWRLEL